MLMKRQKGKDIIVSFVKGTPQLIKGAVRSFGFFRGCGLHIYSFSPQCPLYRGLRVSQGRVVNTWKCRP